MFNSYFTKTFTAIIFIFLLMHVSAQDKNVLLKQAKDLELKFDEPGALEKYKQIVSADSSDIFSLVKCAEFNCSIGERQKDKKVKAIYFDSASVYAQKAYQQNSNNADACYVMALVAIRKTEVEDDNKKLFDDIKQIKIYADRALAINPNHAKANYILGKWHFELIHSSWLKRSEIKKFYNAIPDTQIDSAAYYMERSRVDDPYFALDYLDLAKIYQYDHQPAKAIDVLNKLVKLPTRTFDDAAIKEEGKKMLAGMQ
jgi:hypothetical protein